MVSNSFGAHISKLTGVLPIKDELIPIAEHVLCILIHNGDATLYAQSSGSTKTPSLYNHPSYIPTFMHIVV